MELKGHGKVAMKSDLIVLVIDSNSSESEVLDEALTTFVELGTFKE
jgi:hypothetical protein